MEEVKKAINEVTSTPENELIDSLPSNNGVLENKDNDMEPITEEATVEINPATGSYKQLAEKANISEETARLLDLKPEDIYDMPESINDVEVNTEFLKKAILETGSIKEDETELINEVIDLVKEYKKCKDHDAINWYRKFPKKLQDQVDATCQKLNNMERSTKKAMADFILGQIVSDSGFDQISYDFQKSMNEAFNTDGIMSYFIEEARTEFENGIDSTIAKVKAAENEENKEKVAAKIKQLEAIKEAYRQAYTYEGFIAAIKSGKVRVKKKHIDKYKRETSDWLYKYDEKRGADTPFVIQDPTKMAPIIYRLTDKMFTPEQCVAFVIGFYQYTKNYNANDVVDHTFMSYFISNILQIDLLGKDTREKADFINILTKNIITAVKAVNNIPDESEDEINEE